MPPGRKKGAEKTDDIAKLNVGDLVLAKVKGFPPWPAKIGRAEEWKQEHDPKKVFVQFFGTGEIAFVAPSDVQMFNVEARKSLLARLQGKSIKFFAQAVKEICDGYDKPKVDCPTNFNEDNNIVSEVIPDVLGSAKSVEACMVTGIKDDHLVKSTMKPQMGDDELALDHCLTKSDETNIAHTRSDFNCSANDKVSPAMPLEENNETSTGAHSLCNLASLETLSNLSPSAGSEAGNQSEVTLKKRTDQVISAFYTKGSRIKKFKLEANGFKVVTKTENVDSIIHAKDSPKTAVGDLDLSKGFGDSVREDAVNNRSAAESLPAALDSDSEVPDAKETIRLKKRKKGLKIDGEADASKDRLQGDIYERKQKAQLLSKKTTVADIEHSCYDSMNSKGKTSVKSTRKYHMKKQKIDSSGGIKEKEEKYSEPSLREETSTVPKAGNLINLGSGDGAVLGLAKECILALEASSTSVKMSGKKVTDMPTVDVLAAARRKPLSVPSLVKRRAVCIVGSIEERPRTPIHGGSSEKTKALRPVVGPSLNRDAPKQRSKYRQLHNEDCSGSEAIPVKRSPKSSKLHDESVNYLQDLVKIEPKHDDILHVSHLPGRTEFEEYTDPQNKQVLLQSDAKNIFNTHEHMKVSVKVMCNDDPKNTHVDEVSGSQSVGTSQAYYSTLKNNSTYEDRQKMKSKVQPMFNQAAMEISLETSSLVGLQRADIEDPSYVLRESKISVFDQSMKHLIAAAQAKRIASQSISQPLNSTFDNIANVQHKNSSPRTMEDMQHVNSLFPVVSPSMHASQFESEPTLCTEKLEGRASLVHQSTSSGDNELALLGPHTGSEKNGRRVSPVKPSTRASLAGDTEASVAREAFQGMIETLSRTKESIGRATRLAIDCAKYGIASQVVELLIQKLENEPNLHHRVDLFFLVDSIMQRSHKQKGIAGASYSSAVEAALPRLLRAAVPSGSRARENRHQCLKVLRLWLERKILPASVLRPSMDDIIIKRPSRDERSFDDPIREMEGMFVDEYGSNVTMQLPGFLASRIFEREEDDDDNLPSPLSNVTDEAPQIGISIVNQNLRVNQSSEGRNCSQKNEDGELKTLDVSGEQIGSCPSNYPAEEHSTPGSRAGNSDESTFKSYPGFPLLSTDSPPLPLGSPPPPPPLPSSPAPYPAPPPPQQSSPPSQPPPPQSFPHLPPPLPLPFQSYPPPLATHPPLHSSYAPSYQSQAPFTSTRPLQSIPPPPPARPISMPVMQGQYAGPSQNSFAGQPMTMLQQMAYQSCVPSTARENLPFPFCAAIQQQHGHPMPAVTVPPPVPQPPSSHFPFASNVMQQRPDCPHNQPFTQKGYYQPACPIPSSSYLGNQQPYNAMPSGAFVPGHGAVHRWPRPDIAASNCQRPA